MTEEQSLVHRIQSGDLLAFKSLIDQNERLVFHMISRLIDNPQDQEELCQDVFMKVYDKIGDFQFNAKLSTWIATIAYRLTINFLKKKKKYQQEEIDEDKMMNEFTSNVTPESQYSQKDKQQFIGNHIAKLPVQYRTVLTLFHLEEMSYPEIGEIMDMPPGTVKSYLFRGRKLLKKALEGYFKNEEL